MDIQRLDFVAIPSQDAARAVAFYRDVLELRPDDKAQFEFWAGDTCLAIWEPDKVGGSFAPQHNGQIAFHVEDVAAARAELEAKGVEFVGETVETRVCRMATFHDPDGNPLVLHKRFAPYA
jgi:catechol 2,3-dioxygenase-like lactoylglutathione lyase family enzyme